MSDAQAFNSWSPYPLKKWADAAGVPELQHFESCKVILQRDDKGEVRAMLSHERTVQHPTEGYTYQARLNTYPLPAPFEREAYEQTVGFARANFINFINERNYSRFGDEKGITLVVRENGKDITMSHPYSPQASAVRFLIDSGELVAENGKYRINRASELYKKVALGLTMNDGHFTAHVRSPLVTQQLTELVGGRIPQQLNDGCSEISQLMVRVREQHSYHESSEYKLDRIPTDKTGGRVDLILGYAADALRGAYNDITNSYYSDLNHINSVHASISPAEHIESALNETKRCVTELDRALTTDGLDEDIRAEIRDVRIQIGGESGSQRKGLVSELEAVLSSAQAEETRVDPLTRVGKVSKSAYGNRYFVEIPAHGSKDNWLLACKGYGKTIPAFYPGDVADITTHPGRNGIVIKLNDNDNNALAGKLESMAAAVGRLR